MTALGVMLRYRARAAWNRIRDLRHESALKTAAVAVFGGGLWAGLFAASLKSLAFLRGFPDLREDVVYTTMALLFLTLTILLVFSSAILSLSSLFRSPEASLLMASPAPAGSVYAYKTAEGLMFSSWAFFVMGLPPMLAYGIDVGASAVYYVGLPFFFVPFTLMTASAGTLAGLVITGLIPRHRGRIVALLVAAAAVAGLVVGLKVYTASHQGLVFGELWKERVLGHLSFLRARYLPHTWMTKGILLLAAGKTGEALLNWFAVVASAAFAFLVGDLVARKTYAGAFSLAAGGSRHRRYLRSLVGAGVEILARPAGRVSSLFVSKDVRVFLRDPSQWSQVAIFFGLLGIYIVNLRNLRYDLSQPFWRHLISTLNLGSTCLIMGTLTTRFVFPQVSLEGKRFWVLGLAPVRRRQILYGKYAFALGGTLLIAETLVVLSNAMLGMPADVFLVQAASAALVCAGLTGLAVGLGAVFPDYRQADPGRIVSGFGGTLTLILSVVFVTTVVGAAAAFSYLSMIAAKLPGRGVTPREHAWWAAGAIAFACVSTLLAAGLPLVCGVRALDRAEF